MKELSVNEGIASLKNNQVPNKSCFWKHKWTKWYEVKYDGYSPISNKECVIYCQRRQCVKCGKIQEQNI